MTILTAKVTIRGVRPLLFNKFTVDSIPLKRTSRSGVPGNNPEEWKNSFSITDEGQLYLDPSYIFSCLRAGGKFIPKSRGTIESDVAATLQVLSEKILLNRYIPSNIEDISTDGDAETYIDVRPVTRRGVKNIRYRLATNKGWETEFLVSWDGSLINPDLIHSVCIEAGNFAGLGDGRKIGFGRFEVMSFSVLDYQDPRIEHA
ncbi:MULTISPECIES: hypothetical protein [Robertmurraya]|uniref:Uncharacterized protein n=1 Tax=Robertmurraya beringensis TaxID=641660 RepID=A0ABV6KLV6_9BACI